MIDVSVYEGRQLVASAEAEDPKSALLAARTLFDEAIAESKKSIRTFRVVVETPSTTFTYEGRRP